MSKTERQWCEECLKTTDQILLRHGKYEDDWKVTECTICKMENAIC